MAEARIEQAPTHLIARIRDVLPRGRLLSEDEWLPRHKALVIILWGHFVGITLFGIVRGFGVAHSLWEASLLVPIALIATFSDTRWIKTGAISLGLLSSSAILVHLSGGMIEAHFHFFVMIGALTVYQDWLPFLLAIAFVVLHHGLLGVFDPTGVYNHSGAWQNPWRWAFVHGAFVLASSGAYVVSWRMNEKAREEAEDAYHRLRSSEERFRSLVQNALDAVAVIDAKGIVTYVSQSVKQVLGFEAEDLLDTDGFALTHPEDLEAARDTLGTVTSTPGGSAILEVRSQDAQGEWRWIECRLTNLLEDPNVCGVVVNFRDVSPRKHLEEELTHQAFHDPLTGLANRLLLSERVGHALDRTSRNGSPVSLVFVDLDNFKSINDSLGHEAGDELLIGVSQVLRRDLRYVDTAARLGGDEFAILLEETDEDGAAIVALRLLEALKEPLLIGDSEIVVGASIGISCASSPNVAASDLLRNADLAMYVAKSEGKATYRRFKEEMYSASVEAMRLKTDLYQAVEAREIGLFYQPIIDLREGKISGFEGLARWRHPVKGLLSPAAFMRLAEESGVIVDIGRQLIGEGCAQLAAWKEVFALEGPFRMSLNLCAREVDSDTIVKDILSAIDENGLSASDLILEITESLLLRDVDETVRKLAALRGGGIKIAIDDFGTGHSSLSLLRRLPVDILKIDRAFIEGLDKGEQDTAFVEAILDLARALGLETVAEGVETVEQAEILMRLRCDFVQGYHFGRPTEAREAESLMVSGATRLEAIRIPDPA